MYVYVNEFGGLCGSLYVFMFEFGATSALRFLLCVLLRRHCVNRRLGGARSAPVGTNGAATEGGGGAPGPPYVTYKVSAGLNVFSIGPCVCG